MSVAENFFSAAKQLLLATENLKRMDEAVSRLADDVSDIDRRLVRLETIVALDHQAKGRNPRHKKDLLSGERG